MDRPGGRIPAWTATGSRHVMAIGCAAWLAGCAGSTLSVIEENDSVNVHGRSDQDYTQGLRVSAVFPADTAPTLARRAAELARVTNATTEAIGVFVGQDMYTPADISVRRLQRHDRPYAGWLYGGMVVANVERPDTGPTGDTLDSYELQIGVVGPDSHAEVMQKRVHRITDSTRPRGWDNQLANEVGAVVSYEHRRRLFHFDDGDSDSLGLDGIGGVGASLGNVFTHAQGSLTVRFGAGLPRDFGINTIHRSVAEVGPPDESLRGFSWYVFGGAEGRAVARNIFLDGNTWRDSHDVEKETFVAEGVAGLALQMGNWRLTFSQNVRSREFVEQLRAQRFGSLSLTYQFDF